MDFGQLLQPSFSFPCQLHQNTSAVGAVDNPAQQFEFCHSIHEFDGGVVANEQKLRKITYGNRVAAGKPPDDEQRLMLLRREPGLVGSGTAEGLKFPQLISQPCERLIIHIYGSGRVATTRVLGGADLARSS